jgi:hypothetical protein
VRELALRRRGPAVAAIWTAAQFEVPLLGLQRASAGEVILAARPLLGGE